MSCIADDPDVLTFDIETLSIEHFIPPDAPIRRGEPALCPKHFYELSGPCFCPPGV